VEKIITAALLLFMLYVLIVGSALTLPAVVALQHISLLLG
jgi:hypothetical protein